MATLVHFHISADNTDRARKFYQHLFGWKFTALPGPMKYELIETYDLQGKTGTGGGMSTRDGGPRGIINYFGVQSIQTAMEGVVKLGGRITTAPQPVPGWGTLAVCEDPEGNTFGLFEERK